MSKDLKAMYKTIMDDHFTPQMEVSFVDGDKRQTLFYEKVSWVIDDVNKGLRYGENPGQEAALYRLVNLAMPKPLPQANTWCLILNCFNRASTREKPILPMRTMP